MQDIGVSGRWEGLIIFEKGVGRLVGKAVVLDGGQEHMAPGGVQLDGIGGGGMRYPLAPANCHKAKLWFSR